jgi:hypothetical protein
MKRLSIVAVALVLAAASASAAAPVPPSYPKRPRESVMWSPKDPKFQYIIMISEHNRSSDINDVIRGDGAKRARRHLRPPLPGRSHAKAGQRAGVARKPDVRENADLHSGVGTASARTTLGPLIPGSSAEFLEPLPRTLLLGLTAFFAHALRAATRTFARASVGRRLHRA